MSLSALEYDATSVQTRKRNKGRIGEMLVNYSHCSEGMKADRQTAIGL